MHCRHSRTHRVHGICFGNKPRTCINCAHQPHHLASAFCPSHEQISQCRIPNESDWRPLPKQKKTLEIAIHESSSIPRVPWRPPTRLGCWRAQMKTCRWPSRRFEGPSQPAHPLFKTLRYLSLRAKKRACLTQADLLGFRIRHILNDSVSDGRHRPHLCVSSTGDSSHRTRAPRPRGSLRRV